MGLSKLNREIALNYASKLLRPLKYGENGMFFWFPASGMTTIVSDILRNRTIWKSVLAGLATRIETVELWGHLCEKKDQEHLFALIDPNGIEGLTNRFLKILNKGSEVAIIVGRVDDFPREQRIKILKSLVKLNSLNSRRIHILFNSHDKPWFEKTLKRYPEFLVLANTIQIMPVIRGSLLNNYIDENAMNFGFKMSSLEKENVIKTYGGILQLTKEFLRSSGRTTILELKLRLVWQSVPKPYKQILQNLQFPKSGGNATFLKDLEEFGVMNLELFSKYWGLLGDNPERMLLKLLTVEENNLWEYLNQNPRSEIEKDKIIDILRPQSSNEISFWAIDQAISRFRKKLARAGIDPEQLHTLKGRGYVWKG